VGANVLSSRSIEFARKFAVPLQKRSSFSDVEGTWITPEADWMRDTPVCGAAMVKDEARITIRDVPDQPGVSHRIFSAIAEKNIVVDMIAQNVGSGGKASIGFTVLANELHATLDVLRPLAEHLGAKLEHEENVSKVSVVGTGMRTHTGVAERMFAALSAAGVNMKMITTGDIKISVLVDKADGVKALRAVHQAFELHAPRPGAGLPVPHGTSVASGSTESVLREVNTVVRSQGGMEDIVVSDVLLGTDQGRITIFNLPDRPGVCSRVFQAVAQGGIVVDMIVQNITDPGRVELSFSVPKTDLESALKLTETLAREIDAGVRVSADAKIAKLFVLGVGMRTHTGVARRMFGALAERGINISMINTSEVRLGVVVEERHGQEALAALKKAFQIP
jgi:aspartate kinase